MLLHHGHSSKTINKNNCDVLVYHLPEYSMVRNKNVDIIFSAHDAFLE